MENEDDRSDETGFSGLSSMASDVEDFVTKASTKQQPPASRPTVSNPSPKKSDGQVKKHTPQQTASLEGQPPDPAGKWLLFIVIIVGLMIWASSGSDDSSRKTSEASPAMHAASSKTPPKPARPTTSKPPVGNNNVLSSAQIRYCVAEEIRLDAVGQVVSNYENTQIDLFNRYVDDYNSRCSEFRYRVGALKAAQGAMEPYRRELEKEGFARIDAGKNAERQASATTPSVSKKTKPQPSDTVLAIQHELTKKGYSPGPIDGFMGAKTRGAIISYQTDMDLPRTGSPTESLLNSLRSSGVPKNQPSPSQTANVSTSRAGTLTHEERTGIEKACAYEKRTQGPAVYQACVKDQIAALARQGGKPAMSHLTVSEREGIEKACGYERRTQGPATYHRCVSNQLRSLQIQGDKPDTSRLTAQERDGVERACGYERRTQGPAEYHRCVEQQLRSLSQQGKKPDLSQISYDEREGIEKACGYEKRTQGPASYHRCISEQLSSLSAVGSKPNLSNLSHDAKQMIEKACGYEKRTQGPAAYYRCVADQLRRTVVR